MEYSQKKKVYIKGMLLSSLSVGNVALISHDGLLTRTSIVTSVLEINSSNAKFETKNSHYHVEFIPAPVSAVAARLEYPLYMAA